MPKKVSPRRAYSGALTKPIAWPLAFMTVEEQDRMFRAEALFRVAEDERAQALLNLGMAELIAHHSAFAAEAVQKGRTEAAQRLAALRAKKIPALFRHFGIDPDAKDSWKQLAEALAIQHVAGFGLCRSVGAPKTGRSRDLEIAVRVELIRAKEPGKTLAWAFQNLKKRYPEIIGKSPAAYRRAHSRALARESALNAILATYPPEGKIAVLTWLVSKE